MHADYLLHIYRLVNDGTVALEQLYLTPQLMHEWHAMIDLEQKLSRQVRSSTFCDRMTELDAERKRSASYILKRIRAATHSPIEQGEERRVPPATPPETRRHSQAQGTDRDTALQD